MIMFVLNVLEMGPTKILGSDRVNVRTSGRPYIFF